MSARRRGLGRGLDALLGGDSLRLEDRPAGPPERPPQGETPEGEAAAAPGLTSLPVDRLEPNRYQPRNTFDETGLDELAESIRSQGVVQPIVVTPKGRGRYTIIAGERRWRASRRAGLDRVPVVVREVTSDRQILEMALVENLQRADLNAIEEAEAYRTLSETFRLSQEEIAARVGKGRTTVTNSLRLLRLPEPVQDLVREGRLTAGQARPLLALPDRERQVEMAERAVDKGLTARELEALVSAPGKREKRRRRQELDVHWRAAMENMTRALQTRVEIVRRKRGGLLRVHFHSEEELIRLYDRLMQGNE